MVAVDPEGTRRQSASCGCALGGTGQETGPLRAARRNTGINQRRTDCWPERIASRHDAKVQSDEMRPEGENHEMGLLEGLLGGGTQNESTVHKGNKQPLVHCRKQKPSPSPSKLSLEPIQTIL